MQGIHNLQGHIMIHAVALCETRVGTAFEVLRAQPSCAGPRYQRLRLVRSDGERLADS